MKQLISEHPRNSKFVKRGKLVKFADLPKTYQNALIHYMSVDGAAWAVEEDWDDWKWGEGQPYTLEERSQVMEDIEKFRHRFVDKWGDKLFGCAEVPYQELIEARKGDDDFSSDDQCNYQLARPKIFLEEYTIPTWPVILSNLHHETLQDGWNRFGMYCKLKLNVPVVWYPD